MPHAVPRRIPIAALALSAAACADPSAPLSPGAEAPTPLARVAGPVDAATQPIPDQYIVVFRDDVADVPGLARRLAGANGASVRHTYGAALKGFAGRMPAGAAAALARHPSVAYVEQDQVVSVAGTETNATWGIDRIDDADLPLDGSFNYASDGTGVTAYILDTGIRTSHGEFGGRASGGYTSIADGNGTGDCNGHGTHVAGTVGGGKYGVAQNVRLVAVRVLDCAGSGSWSGVVAGMDWVARNAARPAVANMSLGGGFSQAVNDAAQRIVAAGVTLAVAAGNGNYAGIPQDACSSSPASAPNAITVGSTTRTDTESSFSNYGRCVDILAPGSSITSAWYTGDAATATISGTSMATPHVAGVAALYLSGNTGASPAAVTSAIKGAAKQNTISLHSRSKRYGTPNLFLFSSY